MTYYLQLMVSSLALLYLSSHTSSALDAASVKQRSIVEPGNANMYELHNQIFFIAT